MVKKFIASILSLVLALSSFGSSMAKAEDNSSVNQGEESESIVVEIADELELEEEQTDDSQSSVTEEASGLTDTNSEAISNEEDEVDQEAEDGTVENTENAQSTDLKDTENNKKVESIQENENVQKKNQLRSSAIEKSVSISSNDDNMEIQGDTKYYLNEQGFILYAEVYSGDKITKIQEYYQNTKVENAEQRIKYIFNLTNDGYVVRASKLDEETQKSTDQYEYYPATVYGSHGRQIKYKYSLNADGFLTKATKREQGTQKILAWYVYHPKTQYGNHADKILYKYLLNSAGYVTKATKRERSTQKILAWYVYHPKTKYGAHTNKIMYKYWLNSAGYVTKAAKKEKISQRTITWYVYHPKTRYGSHTNEILYKYWLNSTGFVTKAAKREKGTQRILSWFEYYPKTMYGKHATGIRYKLYLNSSGYVSSGTQREKGTQKVLVSYKFKAKTTYGNQWKQVGERKINVPVVKQLPELPTGCEITAVTMMLQYQGAKVGKLQLANEMPRHPWDPSYGYVGNPYTTKGWTVYPSALMGLVKKHAGKSENLSGYSLMTLEYYLSKNKPVVVWVSPMHGFTVHAITLTGYDKDNFYFNDPWTGAKNVKMSKSKFNKIWTNQKKRAISY